MKRTDRRRPWSRAIRRTPRGCCRWSTRSCAGWPPAGWPANPRGRRSSRPHWSTRRTCGSSAPTATGGWDGRGHFFAAAAEAMRRILIENARRKGRRKHGGDLARVDLAEADLACRMPPDELIALDEAMTRLEAEDPLKAQLVRLRFFAGLSLEEAAEVLGVSAVTANATGVTPGPGSSRGLRGRRSRDRTRIRRPAG